MCKCEQATGIIDGLVAIVPWILIIAGWLFVARDHDRRERRKELRAALSKLTERIHTCEREAHEYWMLPGNSEKASALGVSIKRLLQSIASERTRLQDACDMASSAAEFIAFRRACTGGEFEISTRAGVANASPKLAAISECAVDLVEKLELEFDRYADNSLKSSFETLFRRSR